MWRKHRKATSKVEVTSTQEESKSGLVKDTGGIASLEKRLTNLTGKPLTNVADCSRLGSRANIRLVRPSTDYYARFDSRRWEHHPACLENTRVEVIQQITEWIEDALHGQCILWLNGMAGTGKSTIMHTLARNLAAQNHLAASFFFVRGDSLLGNADGFVTSICYQLAESIPDMLKILENRYCNTSYLDEEFLTVQWKELIIKPLQKVEEKAHFSESRDQCLNRVIIIDALDECLKGDDVALILNLLASLSELRCKNMRVVVSGRPETYFQVLKKIPKSTYRELVLHNVDSTTTRRDITNFYVNQFQLNRSLHNYPEQWPYEESIKALVSRSANYFLHAAETCQFILGRHSQPRKMLSEILGNGPLSRLSTKKLDLTYLQVLETTTSTYEIAYSGLVQQQQTAVRTTVGLISTLFEPLTVSSIIALSGNSDVRSHLKLLSSILDIPEKDNEPVRIIHHSFGQFLYDSERCTNKEFHISQQNAHKLLAERCLDIILANLTNSNLCGVDWPASSTDKMVTRLVQSKLPRHLQYACRYWTLHISGAEETFWCDLKNVELLKLLFARHILYWIEALSLMQDMEQGINGLATLERSLRRLPDKKNWTTMLTDMLRFVRNFGTVIARFPRQIYASTLLQSPERSFLKQTFRSDIPMWIRSIQPAQNDWHAHEMVLLAKTQEEVTTLAFSPDGKNLAYACYLSRIDICHLQSSHVRTLPNTLKRKPFRLQFSPDGSYLACSYRDGSIGMWKSATLEFCCQLGVSRDPNTHKLALTLNGRIFQPKTFDSGLTMWNLAELKGSEIYSKTTYNEPRSIVDFSSDGKSILVSCLRWYYLNHFHLDTHTDQDIKIATKMDWEYKASRLSCDLHLVGYPFPSTDRGGRHMNWTYDRRNPEVSTGTGLMTHVNVSSYMAAYSQDFQYFVICSPENVVQVFDRSCQEVIIQVSLGGEKGALDIRVDQLEHIGQMTWNFGDPSPKPLRKLDHLSQMPRAEYIAAFSQDSKYVAIFVPKQGVYIYDLANRQSKSQASLGDKTAKRMCFSPDGQMLVIAADMGNEQVWIEVATGSIKASFLSHLTETTALAISPDGKMIAVALKTGDVLWSSTDLSKLTQKRAERVRDIVASPSKRIIATGAAGGAVTLWNAEIGQAIRRVERMPFSVAPCAISHDDQWLAIACTIPDDTDHEKTRNQICIVDIATGQIQSTFDIGAHASRCHAATADFSPDGKVFAWLAAPNLPSDDVEVGRVLNFRNIAAGVNLESGIISERSITNSGSTFVDCIAFTADSRYIAFTTPQSAKIAMVDYLTGSVTYKSASQLASREFEPANHPKLLNHIMSTDAFDLEDRLKALALPGWHVDYKPNPWNPNSIANMPWLTWQGARKLLLPFPLMLYPYPWVLGDDYVAFPCPHGGGMKFIFLNDPEPQVVAPAS